MTQRKAVMKKGKLSYKIEGAVAEVEPTMLVMKDPHTGKRFKLPNSVAVLKVCGYGIKRKKT